MFNEKYFYILKKERKKNRKLCIYLTASFKIHTVMDAKVQCWEGLLLLVFGSRFNQFIVVTAREYK